MVGLFCLAFALQSNCLHMLTGSLVCMLVAFHTLPYVPSPSCFVTLYLEGDTMFSSTMSLSVYRSAFASQCTCSSQSLSTIESQMRRCEGLCSAKTCPCTSRCSLSYTLLLKQCSNLPECCKAAKKYFQPQGAASLPAYSGCTLGGVRPIQR